MDIKVQLHLLLYETEGQERFHVHVADSSGELKDVTEHYELVAASNPETGQRGFTLLKKLPLETKQ